MVKKIINSGAEAIIYLEKNQIIKERISKGYRHPELDKKIIKRRTKSEKKLLEKASKFVNIPKVNQENYENKILMEYIEGDKLSESLDTYPLQEQIKVIKKIGKNIGKLHKEGIIHGDLTTSNILYKKGEIYFIDFGLGYFNGKYEDKGVDLHLFKQALEAKHFKNWKKLFEGFKKGYLQIEPEEAKKVFEKLNSIEKRGRYKH
jgi:TP53 regulating kinase-like protein